ncbi:hypothetical protein [Mycoplasma suis]|uniref:Uncharacterized protein n=1 Tax=Mycoplasma suis (strain Illinois) TaxID=768700 RepID=F0QRS5_MYCSL|nr:hypothetical protein [Mycoplasma suis]ADX98195.1 hypothetical protein MSU_0664 [Mycoplasma suis str. Illinois]
MVGGAVKVTALTCLTLSTLGGSFYGSTQIFKEESIPWQSLWIYKEKNSDQNWRKVCELPDSLTKNKDPKGRSKRDLVSGQEPNIFDLENNCKFSKWFQEIIEKNKNIQGDGWWIRGRDEETINKMLEHETLLGDGIPKKLGKETKPERQTQSDESTQPQLTVEVLKKNCEVKERTWYKRRVEITCLEK